jgi:hypothetical protein
MVLLLIQASRSAGLYLTARPSLMKGGPWPRDAQAASVPVGTASRAAASGRVSSGLFVVVFVVVSNLVLRIRSASVPMVARAEMANRLGG